MASDITITSLDATAGLGQIVLSAAWSAAGGRTGLPYAEAAKVEFWGATTNNLGSASKVGESGPAGIHIHGDLSDGTTWYYWARAKDPQGNFGPYSSGISATTKTAALGPDSVGSDELQDGAVNTEHFGNIIVTNAQIEDLSASKLTAGTIDATISIESPTITGGTIRTRDSGYRVELSQSENSLVVYGAFSEIARLNGAGAVLQIEDTGRSISCFSSSPDEAVSVQNQNGAGIRVSLTANGTNDHCVRAFGPGGEGAMGVSSPSGGWAFYALTGGYGPFTGAHDALIAKNNALDIGDIVVDEKVIARFGVSDALTAVSLASEVADRRVAGIAARRTEFNPESMLASLPTPVHGEQATFVRRHLADRYDRLTINALGEGQLNVCGRGGPIQAGDYICTSDLPGKGQRQNDSDGNADDLLRRCTVAQAREAVSFDRPDQVKRIAVFYRCG